MQNLTKCLKRSAFIFALRSEVTQFWWSFLISFKCFKTEIMKMRESTLFTGPTTNVWGTWFTVWPSSLWSWSWGTCQTFNTTAAGWPLFSPWFWCHSSTASDTSWSISGLAWKRTQLNYVDFSPSKICVKSEICITCFWHCLSWGGTRGDSFVGVLVLL